MACCARPARATPTGGRPPMMFAFNEDAGVILPADLGATHARLAVTNLGGYVLAEETRRAARSPRARRRCSTGPTSASTLCCARSAARDADVRGIGIGVPGPVEHATGRPRNPPIMPGWDGYPIPERFADRYNVPVLVDNDVNIMALGEHWTSGARSSTCSSSRSPRDRLRHRRRRADPSRRRRGRRRHRPHPRRRRRRRGADHLHLRQRRLPRGPGRRRGDGARSCASRASRPPTRAPWSSWRAPASRRRCAWCATRAG